MQLWCEWAWLGGDEPAPAVLIEVVGDRIATIGSQTDPPPGAVRLPGLTLPGFANAHSHAFHRALRGRTHGGEGSFWTWREQMYELAASLEPDTYHDLAVEVYREMIAAGFTVVGEFHYLHHRPSGDRYERPNAMSEAIVAAADAAGIRLTLLDTLYLSGGLGIGGEYLTPNPIQRRFSDGSDDAWVERVDALASQMDGRGAARLGVAIHSVRAVDPASMETAVGWAAGRQVPLHAHVSEQPAENEQCRTAHGVSPVALLDRLGALGPRFTAVHATHLTDDDIARLGHSGSTACFCPTTERDLADGIGPSGRLAEAGVPLAIGSDSHAFIDPFEEIRAIELNQRLATLRRGTHRVTQLLEAGTGAGYRALGWPEGGTIEPGALADLVTVTLTESDPAHMLASVVYGTRPTDVTNVMVGGRVVRRPN